MARFITWIFKWIFVLLFSTILLLLAAWNVPQTRGIVVLLQERVENRFQIDIDQYATEFMKYYNKFRGVHRSCWE